MSGSHLQSGISVLPQNVAWWLASARLTAMAT